MSRFMSCKIAIIVLHYEYLKDTKECLDSLIKYLNGDEIQIVVVDNGSNNGKISQIVPYYEKYKQIKFLISPLNMGFAKGNNLGFMYAKYNLNPEIIVLANNDLLFEQKGFFEKLVKLKEESNFDIAGPRTISLIDGKNQNPVGVVFKSIRSVNRRIYRVFVLYLLSFFNLDIWIKKHSGNVVNEYVIDKGQDYQLHGACMFFSNNYLKKYDGLYSGTFMYGEEFILKYIVDKDNLIMRYFDEIEVLHKESSSSNEILGKGQKHRRFFYKWSISSLLKLRKMIRDDR